MNKILQNLLVIVIVAVAAILLYRWAFPSSEEIKRLRDQIDSTLALADSLQKENKILLDANAVLRLAEQKFRAKNDSLQEVNNDQKDRLALLGRRVRLFPGTPDSLHRDLNRLAGIAVLACPE